MIVTIAIRKVLREALFLSLFVVLFGRPTSLGAQQDGATDTLQHVVEPGDTWTALSLRYAVTREMLQSANWHPNPLRNPVIGDTITIPTAPSGEHAGRIRRRRDGGLLQLAAIYNQSPWQLATINGMAHPFLPLFQRAVFVPGGADPPRDLPHGFQSLQLSAIPAQPGWPLAFRATAGTLNSITAQLGSARIETFQDGLHIVGVGGTGAFFNPGAPELTIAVDGLHRWSQPWRVAPGLWDYDQVTLTGEAAAIDQEAIAAERERMFQLWSQITPRPLWQTSFRRPIDNFLRVSSTYGARRSYNGGPYSTYHEGVDFSAYSGTPVMASGDGAVVLAEELYVRGGAVVIDHGLGIYSGYYHMSAVHVQTGANVRAGDLVGEVGSKGLSSGNHLHWDLLVAGTWVDALAWQELGLACWILEGWGTPCLAQP